MSDIAPFLGIALGVLIAVVYPVLKGYVLEQFGPTEGHILPVWFKKYLALLCFCLVTALLVLAVYRNQNPDAAISFWQALLLGFGYEASIEKLFSRPLASEQATDSPGTIIGSSDQPGSG